MNTNTYIEDGNRSFKIKLIYETFKHSYHNVFIMDRRYNTVVGQKVNRPKH